MLRVAELAKGVVDEFRNKKKNSLKRTFVAASDAASSKVKGTKCKFNFICKRILVIKTDLRTFCCCCRTYESRNHKTNFF